MVKKQAAGLFSIEKKNRHLFQGMPSIEDNMEWSNEKKKKIVRSGRPFNYELDFPEGCFCYKVGKVIRFTEEPTGLKVKTVKTGNDKKFLEFYKDDK